MTRIVSITMAEIIMMTAGVTAPQTYAAAPQTITVSAKAKSSSHTNKKKKKHKHSIHHLQSGFHITLYFFAQKYLAASLFS